MTAQHKGRLRLRLINFVLALLLILAGISGVVNLAWIFRAEPLRIGVSFSQKYANELGIDWQETYQAILDDLDVKYIRLMSYWDLHEPAQDKYNFSDLDWQFDQAKLRGTKVSLAIGLRQPRWPECHEPEWAKNLSEPEQIQALQNYIRVVVERYRSHSALESYQLENEVANSLFGICRGFDRQQLTAELQLVKKLDQNHPVIINTSNQSGIPMREPVGDLVGFSVYRKSDIPIGGRHFYWSFRYVPPAWHTMRAFLVEQIHDRPVLIHELQAEPWGPKPNRELTTKEQDQTMSPRLLAENLAFARATGIRTIYLWGAEWWYWRLTTDGDARFWDTTKSMIKATQ